jgi:hypothetical protein
MSKSSDPTTFSQKIDEVWLLTSCEQHCVLAAASNEGLPHQPNELAGAIYHLCEQYFLDDQMDGFQSDLFNLLGVTGFEFIESIIKYRIKIRTFNPKRFETIHILAQREQNTVREQGLQPISTAKPKMSQKLRKMQHRLEREQKNLKSLGFSDEYVAQEKQLGFQVRCCFS